MAYCPNAHKEIIAMKINLSVIFDNGEHASVEVTIDEQIMSASVNKDVYVARELIPFLHEMIKIHKIYE